MTSLPLFQNIFILTRPRVVISADIIKIVTMFNKTIFEDSKNYVSITQLCIKMQSISVFLDIAKFADFR